MYWITLLWLILLIARPEFSEQAVSANDSIIYGLETEGSMVWVAGQPVRFFVQLRDFNQANITNVFDDQLRVACATDSSAPGNTSFCLEEPWITPIRPGCYAISVTIGTIWGAYHNRDEEVIQHAATDISQGNNSIEVTYGGIHLPGSPLRPTLMPELSVSRYHSYVTQVNQAIQATEGDASVATFVQIADQYTNWIRDASLVHNMTWLLVNASTEDTARMHTFVAWSLGMSGMQLMVSNTTKCGAYNYTMKYSNPYGYEDTELVLFKGKLQEHGKFLVRPRGPHTMHVVPTGEFATAGEPFQYTIHVQDEFGNPTALMNSYLWFREPFYTGQEQNMNMLQVNSTQVNCTSCTIPTTEMAIHDIVGVVTLYVVSTSVGSYKTDIYFKDHMVYSGHHAVAHGLPHINTSSLLMENTSMHAGSPPCWTTRISDKYGNEIPWMVLTRQQGVSVHMVLPNGSTTDIQINNGFNPSDILHIAAGEYQVALVVGQATQEPWAFNVLPSPKSSPYFSRVYGPGLGVMRHDMNWNEKPFVIAGISYNVSIEGYDAWDNPQKGIDPGFKFSTEFTSSCELVTYEADPTTGKTTITYNIVWSGDYTLTIYTPDEEIVHQQSLTVVPHPVVDKVLLEWPHGTAAHMLTAGSTVDLYMMLRDRFNNTMFPSMSLIEVRGAYVGGAYIINRTNVDIQGRQRFAASFKMSGDYAIIAIVPSYNYTREVHKLTIVPDVAYAKQCFLKGPQSVRAQSSMVIQLVLRDQYGNNVQAVDELIPDLHVTIMPHCDCLVRVFVENDIFYITTMVPNTGFYEVYITIQQEPIQTFPHHILVLPSIIGPPCCGPSANATNDTRMEQAQDCSQHGTWHHTYCLCDSGWWTDTGAWVRDQPSVTRAFHHVVKQ